MPGSTGRIPHLGILLAGMGMLCLVPPELLARGPALCLWKHLFHLAACPACGSTRALVAFFHGQFAQALTFNLNVVVTGPVLLVMFALDALRILRQAHGALSSSLNSRRELTTVLKPE
jgi:hypothetical protein